ncbi:MAG: response regulator [Candidatus Riflebacteria bacterium]|nr:response regulator [Candidatus Riflebacteria bacterium]
MHGMGENVQAVADLEETVPGPYRILRVLEPPSETELEHRAADEPPADRSNRDGESEALYHDLIANMSAGVYRLRVRMGACSQLPAEMMAAYEFVSDSYCELLGLAREDLQADVNVILKRVHVDDRGSFLARNLEASRMLQPFLWEGRVCVEGRVRWLRIESRPRVLENGDALWTGVTVDITERVRSEERLRRINGELRAIRAVNRLITRERDPQELARMACRLLVESRSVDSCTIVRLQRKRVEFVETSGGEPDHRWPQAVTDFASLPEFVRRAIDEGLSVARTRETDGGADPIVQDPAACRAEVAVRLESEGTVFGVFVATMSARSRWDEEDLGLLRELACDVAFALRSIQLERQLTMAQKLEAVGSLAGGIAHDFNNLLSIIINYAQFAIEGARDDDPVRSDLLAIRTAGERAASLTRQLLAFSRRQVLQPAVVDLNSIVNGMLGMLKRLIGEDVELIVAPEPALGRVRADAGQLEQVILNLVINARDAMPGGGRLTIETANAVLGHEFQDGQVEMKSGPAVVIRVTDTGCGIEESVVGRIFEPFFTTKQPGKGTGLGLATVYGIVKQSGGDVQVTSEPGRGTTFCVYLPRVPSPTESETGPLSVQPRSAGTETVLIVEDDEAVRGLAERLLASAGYTVLTAADGNEALALSERHPGRIDLVLTDVVMPRMNGPMLVERLAAARSGIQELFMSGHADDAGVLDGSLDRDARFIAKPFCALDLWRKVRQLLDTPRRRAH